MEPKSDKSASTGKSAPSKSSLTSVNLEEFSQRRRAEELDQIRLVIAQALANLLPDISQVVDPAVSELQATTAEYIRAREAQEAKAHEWGREITKVRESVEHWFWPAITACLMGCLTTSLAWSTFFTPRFVAPVQKALETSTRREAQTAAIAQLLDQRGRELTRQTPLSTSKLMDALAKRGIQFEVVGENIYCRTEDSPWFTLP